MSRAKVALVAGILVVLATFAYGVEAQISTTVAGQRVGCDSAISVNWLVSGTADAMANPDVTTSPAGRRASAACEAAVQRARTGVLSTMAAGALLALVGWTAMGEPRTSQRVGRPHASAT